MKTTVFRDKTKSRYVGFNPNKEYENNINALRFENGFTLKELAGKIGIGPQYLWRIAEGYEGPFYEKRSPMLKPWAYRLCEVLKCEIGDLFPREACTLNKSITQEQFFSVYTDYEKQCEPNFGTEMYFDREVISMVIDTLPKRLSEILKYYFWEDMNFRDISKKIGVSSARVAELFHKALRILRHPTRSRKLKDLSFNVV